MGRKSKKNKQKQKVNFGFALHDPMQESDHDSREREGNDAPHDAPDRVTLSEVRIVPDSEKLPEAYYLPEVHEEPKAHNVSELVELTDLPTESDASEVPDKPKVARVHNVHESVELTDLMSEIHAYESSDKPESARVRAPAPPSPQDEDTQSAEDLIFQPVPTRQGTARHSAIFPATTPRASQSNESDAGAAEPAPREASPSSESSDIPEFRFISPESDNRRLPQKKEKHMSMNSNAISGKVALFAILGILVLILLFSSFYSINEGERGVLLTNGRLTEVVPSGLHFKLPFFQSVSAVSTRTVTIEGQVLSMYSFDQQIAELSVSVTFHIDPEQVKDMYTRYGTIQQVFINGIQPRVHEISKTVFGQYTAARAIQERGKLNNDMNIEIKKALADIPAVIENIQIENVDFSDTYERAVEEAARAKADIERAKSELARVEQEAQQKVKNADAEAAATKARADAEAYSIKVQGQAKADANAYQIRVQGEAEAEAIRLRAEALSKNPQFIQLIQAQKWNGVLPTTMVPGSTLPFIDVK